MPLGVDPFKSILYPSVRHIHRPVIRDSLEHEVEVEVFILESPVKSVEEVGQRAMTKWHLIFIVDLAIGIQVVILQVAGQGGSYLVGESALINLFLTVEVTVTVVIIHHVAPLLP